MSDGRLRAAGVALALAGLALSGYLTWVRYSGGVPICGGEGGCETVQASRWSEVAGVPVAVLGLAGYGSLLVALLPSGDGARAAAAFLALAGLGFSGWLTYLELFEIEAICVWCVASALLMTGLAVIAVVRLMMGERI